jgi:hypothetical protein
VREIILARWFGEGDDITEGSRITWMRVLCSGYQPVPA